MRFTSETGTRSRQRQAALGRAAFWRAHGWANLKRAWVARDAYNARYSELRASGVPMLQARELAKNKQ